MGWLDEILGALRKLADQSSRPSTNPPMEPTRRPPPHSEPRSASAGPPSSTPSAGNSSNPSAGNSSNPLAGKRLRYKIGADNPGRGNAEEIVEVGYDWEKPLPLGISIAYCNLFNEKYSEQSKKERAEYAPYLKTSDTAEDYGEGQIDPRGTGWRRNLTEQFERRRKQGFEYIELDNPDAYSVADVVAAVELAANYGLKVIAKNPGLMEGDPLPYVSHRNVHGIIVEKGAGDAHEMDALRRRAGKPEMPVWFVFFDARKGHDTGKKAAKQAAGLVQRYRGMSVTYSPGGEYTSAVDETA
jgi:hypothetical protein